MSKLDASNEPSSSILLSGDLGQLSDVEQTSPRNDLALLEAEVGVPRRILHIPVIMWYQLGFIE